MQEMNRPLPTSWQQALYLSLIIFAWVAFVLAGGWLLSYVVNTILVLVLSGIVAVALTPLVPLLSRRMPRRYCHIQFRHAGHVGRIARSAAQNEARRRHDRVK